MSGTTCPKCGFRNDAFVERCERCGSVLSAARAALANIYAQLDHLVDPLEGVLRESKLDIDATDLLAVTLMHISLHVASIEDDISDKEATIIREMYGNVTHDPDVDNMPVDVPNSGQSLSKIRAETAVYRKSIYDEPVFMLRLLLTYDAFHGTEYGAIAKTMLFRFLNWVVKADGKVSKRESDELIKLKSYLDSHTAFGTTKTEAPESEKPKISVPPGTDNKQPARRSLGDLLAELKQLVGLDLVKNEISALVDFTKVQQLRQQRGMPISPVSHHLVFSGNPGTGKTTVARLVSQIYAALGVLSKGHLIETDRSGLVAGYIGQTALKVQEVVQGALGGILFIDEAYSLSSPTEMDFGHEAIATLLKLMEDHRDDLIVIAAGYTDKIEAFVNSNPGLRSRFNKYLQFDDYSPLELLEIFKSLCAKNHYVLSGSAEEILLQTFADRYRQRDETFGNARLARNIFEQAIENQASRVAPLSNVTDQILCTIEATDLAQLGSIPSKRPDGEPFKEKHG